MILSDTVHIKYVSSGTKKEMYKWVIVMCWGCRTRGHFCFSNCNMVMLLFFLNNSFTKI